MSATKGHIKLLLLLAAGLLAACSPNEPPQPEAQDEICLNATVWQMMQGAPARSDSAPARPGTQANAPLRAMTYEPGTLTSGSFTAAAYVENTTDVYIAPVQVNYITDKWVWSDGKHYWPASGSLDFFAYMPASAPSYITDNSDVASQVSYVARNPQFKCKNLPMTYDSASPSAGQGSGLQEFVYALVTDQNKTTPGASGVSLNFQRPFAKINLQLSSTQADIHIDKITFKNIKNNGSYTHSSGWTTSGANTNLVLTLDDDYEANDEIGTFIMVPQAWAGQIEVVATWTDWGEDLPHTLTATKATTWVAGTSYTYTFTIKETDLIVDAEKFTEQW